jgi:hypothetical protein
VAKSKTYCKTAIAHRKSQPYVSKADGWLVVCKPAIQVEVRWLALSSQWVYVLYWYIILTNMLLGVGFSSLREIFWRKYNTNGKKFRVYRN